MMAACMGAIMAVVIVAVFAADVVREELRDPNSRINSARWCRRHGLKMLEWIGQECAQFWCGEDADGNCFAPGSDGEPQYIGKRLPGHSMPSPDNSNRKAVAV